MATFKSRVRSIIERFGYRIFRESSLSHGVDLCLDIGRVLGRERIQYIIDAGANIGQTAIHFAAEFPSATISSFEPVNETFAELAARTGRTSNIRCYNYALGSTSGNRGMYKQSHSILNTLVESLNRPTRANEVPVEVGVITLDEFVRQHSYPRIDLLKTDTEGYDLEVLKGADNYLRSGKVKSVLSEVSFDFADQRHSNFEAILAFLTDRGFCFHALYDMIHSRDGRLEWCNALFFLLDNNLSKKTGATA